MTEQLAADAAAPPPELAQFLRLFNDPDMRSQRMQVSWPSTQPWPPPERMAYITGLHGWGNEALITAEGYDQMTAHAAENGRSVEDSFEVAWYTRVRYSQLDAEEVMPGTHLSRGAAYIPETGRLDIRCNGCKRPPSQIDEYSPAATGSDLSPEEFVQAEEGTYNDTNGHFLCTGCYIDADMPTMPGGRGRWIAP